MSAAKPQSDLSRFSDAMRTILKAKPEPKPSPKAKAKHAKTKRKP